MINTTLYKCFIPIDTSTDYTPNMDSDIFAVSELEAVELLLNEENYMIRFPPHSLSEIPKYIQKRIERAGRKRFHIQNTLKTGNINEIRKIKLIITEIKIDPDDIQSITESQINEKYLCISLQNATFSIRTYEKHIKELGCEFNTDTGQVNIKEIGFTK